MIPCRSQTDMKLAQHLLSPMSAPQRSAGTDEAFIVESDESSSSVTRILNFGSSPTVLGGKKKAQKPLSVLTHSSAGHPGKVKIPTKPDRVMAAPGTFLDCGKPF